MAIGDVVTGRSYDLIENFIYIYQLDKYCIIPTYPDTISDSMGSTFSSENILGRTVPVFTYSGPTQRKISFQFSLHRDLMYDLNRDNTKFQDEIAAELNEDYVDTLIRYLQAMGMPSYTAVNAADTYNKMLNPPMVAVRFGNEIFIKGIVSDSVQVQYTGAITSDNKYTEVNISFSVTEIEPQDANSIAQYGGMRPLSSLLSIRK